MCVCVCVCVCECVVGPCDESTLMLLHIRVHMCLETLLTLMVMVTMMMVVVVVMLILILTNTLCPPLHPPPRLRLYNVPADTIMVATITIPSITITIPSIPFTITIPSIPSITITITITITIPSITITITTLVHLAQGVGGLVDLLRHSVQFLLRSVGVYGLRMAGKCLNEHPGGVD